MLVEIGVIIAVLVGISEIAKKLNLPVKYVPLMNLLLGIVCGFFVVDAPVFEQVITGAIIGLSASGLYDQKKIVTKK